MLVIRVREDGIIHLLDNTGKPLVDVKIVDIDGLFVKVGFIDPPSGREVTVIRDGVKFDAKPRPNG